MAHLEDIGGHPALHEKHGLLRRVRLFGCPGFELGEGVDEGLKLLGERVLARQRRAFLSVGILLVIRHLWGVMLN